MPQIEVNGQLQDIIDCPACRRTVFVNNPGAVGWIATCGRRLVNPSQLRPEGCGDVDLGRRCDSNLVAGDGSCFACAADQGEARRSPAPAQNPALVGLTERSV